MLTIAVLVALALGFVIGWISCCQVFDIRMSKLTKMQDTTIKAQERASEMADRLKEKLDMLEALDEPPF